MEELLAQLLQQRAIQTKSESDAKHSMVQSALSQLGGKPKVFGMAGSKVEPMTADDHAFMARHQTQAPGMPGNPVDLRKQQVLPTWRANVTAGDTGVSDQPGGNPDMRIEQMQDPVDNERRGLEPADLLDETSVQKDDDVQQTGWLPADFNDMSGNAAIALIADQLRTRRIRQMGELSPDYLQTLPTY